LAPRPDHSTSRSPTGLGSERGSPDRSPSISPTSPRAEAGRELARRRSMSRLVASFASLAAAALAACTGGSLTPGESGTADAGPTGQPGGDQSRPGDLGCELQIDLQVTVEAFPPDLFLVVDRSSSMAQSVGGDAFVRKWDVL